MAYILMFVRSNRYYLRRLYACIKAVSIMVHCFNWRCNNPERNMKYPKDATVVTYRKIFLNVSTIMLIESLMPAL